MKIVRLETENFKGLRAVEITPTGDIVTIGGKNGQGKSSVLDAIWVALAGKAVAPPVPVRKGEEKCTIRLEIGNDKIAELIITRTFTNRDDGKVTDTVKVESGDGKQRYNAPQGMLDDLMGQIGFDPFAFVQMKPEAQADMLLQLVPLPIDLEAMAREDTADYANRRDKNRDADQLRGQIAAIPLDESLPATPIDREAIVAELGGAADTNSAIERERIQRQEDERSNQRGEERAASARQIAKEKREEAARLIGQAEQHEKAAAEIDDAVKVERARLAALPPLDPPVDTEEVRQRLRQAEETNAAIESQARRRELVAGLEKLTAEAQELTDAMADRERGRKQALAGAKMPIEGLAFAVNEKGKPTVELNGLPFEQANTSDQIRASTAIAMSANPELRVLRIKDGSLLDEDSMAIIAGMAAEEDFQLWVEVVGTGGVGIVIEAGEVKGAETPAKEEAKPKAAKAKPAAEAGPAGPLL